MSETTQSVEQFKLPDLEERLESFRKRGEETLAKDVMKRLDLGIDL